MRKIHFRWFVKPVTNSERVGAMYCFKRCDIDQR